MKGFTKIIIFSILAWTMVFSLGSLALADDGIVPSGGKDKGDYQLNDLVLVGVNVSKWILGLSGSLALLAFVVGGLYFIMAGGNKEYVEKGKSAMIAAVIGLVIVFTAYTAIGYFLAKLGYQDNVFGAWNTTPDNR